MLEQIRNKYLYNKTQIIELNKGGIVITSDNLVYPIDLQCSIADFHPFFETIISLIDLNNEDFTFSCIHLDINSEKKTIDIIFNSGSKENNPILIFFDFTEHYNNFQNIAQEKNESILSFHLAELKNQQLESEKNFKNKFLANVSHDLRTPISASLWFVGMLEKSDTTDSQKEMIQLLKETNHHIKELVDDILDLSKIEMGEIRIHNTSFDFGEMIHHIEKIIAPKAKARNLDFKVIKDEKLPKFIVGDKTRIVQIIINLLDNAVKFTKKGRVLISFMVKEISNDSAVIHIKTVDTGSGIKANDKDEVFQSFKKLHDSKKIEGSGLGLSIVSNLLELMGGTIDYETEINIGTTFNIELPLLINSEVSNELKPFEYIKISNKLDVLIVEDDEINQLLLMKLLLNHGGFNINVANNGLQALEMIERNPYDLIFMDKEMPQMNGIKTTSIIRSNPNDKINLIPIIGVSGHSVKTEKGICDALGFNGYVTKPFKKEEIYEAIYAVLKLKKS
jgi:signal transduction histidine kinase/CheY-like chemotaxis protein